MSVLHRAHRRTAATQPSAPATSAAATSDLPTAPTDPTPETPSTARVPGTRTSATWIGLCAVALAGVLLIVFMLQNTRSVDVSFLWMDGSLPLALALFIAAVGAGLLAMIVGSARITQLRHRFRQHR